MIPADFQAGSACVILRPCYQRGRGAQDAYGNCLCQGRRPRQAGRLLVRIGMAWDLDSEEKPSRLKRDHPHLARQKWAVNCRRSRQSGCDMSAIFTSEPRLALPEYRLKRIVSLPTLELLGGAFVQEVHDMGWGAFVLRLMLSPCTTARQMQRCPSLHRPTAHGRRQTRVSYKPSWSPSTGFNSAFSKSVRLAVQKSVIALS